MSRAYYNEIDPFCVAWLRNLIAAGLIPDGDVDSRSIRDVKASDVAGYTQCHFFAGLGGWAYAARLAQWPDDKPLWTGSCPCQPYSLAGRGEGDADPRNLWPAWFQLIRDVRPPVIAGEQVASAIKHLWLDRVCADVEGEGYAWWASVLPACAVNAPHRRDRLWFVADLASAGQHQGGGHPGQQAGQGSGLGRQPHHPSGGLDAAGAVANAASRGRAEGEPRARNHAGQTPALAHGTGARSGVEHVDDSRCFDGPGLQAVARSDRAHDGLSDATGGSRGHEAVADAGGQGSPLSERGGQREPAVAGDADAGIGEAASERGGACGAWADAEWIIGADGKARRVEPGIRLLAHGVPGRVGKLRAFGNAIVPQVGATILRTYRELEAEAADPWGGL